MVGILEFLDAKGSLDVLFQLANREKSFNELKEVFTLSPNTVLDRLREAQSLDLIKEELLISERVTYALGRFQNYAVPPL